MAEQKEMPLGMGHGRRVHWTKPVYLDKMVQLTNTVIAAEKLGISKQSVSVYLRDGECPGVVEIAAKSLMKLSAKAGAEDKTYVIKVPASKDSAVSGVLTALDIKMAEI